MTEYPTKISLADESYPALLKKIPNAPIRLWTLGAGLDPQALYVGAVGSRDATPEMQREFRLFLNTFLTLFRDMVVISGLAEGIDTVAHLAALENEIPTVAVLPTAINNVYPK